MTQSSRRKKGQIVGLDIEIWPTSIIVPAGYRIGLSVRGKDYVYPGGSGGKLSNFKNELTGCGPFLHDDPRDRPPELFAGTTTLHFSVGRAAYVLLPVIPQNERPAKKNQASGNPLSCHAGRNATLLTWNRALHPMRA